MAIGASAATLLGSGILGASAIGSTVSGNKGNASIAQQNNAFNEKMLQKQMDYNTQMYQQQLGDQWQFYNDAKQNSWDMFNASNDYNSASAQRERLEAAGLNPYLMMSGGNAGTATAQASTQASSPSAQGVTPPTATPYSADYSGITQGLGMVLDKIATQPDRDVKSAQADNLRIEGKYKAAKTIAEIVQMRTNAKTQEGRLALDKLIYSIDKDLKTSQMDVNRESIANMQAERKLTNVQTLLADKQLSWMDAQNKIDLAQKTADIQLKYAQGALTKKQVEHEVNKIAETAAKTSLIGVQTKGQSLQNQGQSLQNQFDSATFGNRVKAVKESLWNLMHESDSFGVAKTIGRVIRPLYD